MRSRGCLRTAAFFWTREAPSPRQQHVCISMHLYFCRDYHERSMPQCRSLNNSKDYALNPYTFYRAIDSSVQLQRGVKSFISKPQKAANLIGVGIVIHHISGVSTASGMTTTQVSFWPLAQYLATDEGTTANRSMSGFAIILSH